MRVSLQFADLNTLVNLVNYLVNLVYFVLFFFFLYYFFRLLRRIERHLEEIKKKLGAFTRNEAGRKNLSTLNS